MREEEEKSECLNRERLVKNQVQCVDWFLRNVQNRCNNLGSPPDMSKILFSIGFGYSKLVLKNISIKMESSSLMMMSLSCIVSRLNFTDKDDMLDTCFYRRSRRE